MEPHASEKPRDGTFQILSIYCQRMEGKDQSNYCGAESIMEHEIDQVICVKLEKLLLVLSRVPLL